MIEWVKNIVKNWSFKMILQSTCYWLTKNVYSILFGVITALGLFFWKYYILHYISNKWTITPWYKDFVESMPYVNWLIFITSIIFLIAFIYHLYQSASIKSAIRHTIIYIMIGLACFKIPAFYAVSTVMSSLDYHVFAVIAMGACFAIEVELLIYRKITKKKDNTSIPDSNKELIEVLIKQLNSNSNSNECFTVGLASPWGSGKTTFLAEVKKQLKGNELFVVRTFNPWQMVSAEQINSEFFALLKSLLEKDLRFKQLDLIKLVTKYSSLITAVPNVPKNVIETLVELLPEGTEQTISELHRLINDGLAKSDKKILVIIDDLDRLEYDELFEVLRLIRVSANFQNIVFLVAYDKQYIIQNLADHGVPRGDEYLKKIINLEICIPQYEKYTLGNLLFEKIKENVEVTDNQQEELRNAFRRYPTEHGFLINDYLHNYRDVERLAQYFSLILNYLHREGNNVNLNLSDLFWIEVLHYYHNDIYETLKENHWSLLKVYQKNSDCLIYEEKTENRNVILAKLFTPPTMYYTPEQNSISRIANISMYFSYRSLEDNVSIQELKENMQNIATREELASVVENLVFGHKMQAFINALNYYATAPFETALEQLNYIRTLLYASQYFDTNSSVSKQFRELFALQIRSPHVQNLKVSAEQLFDEFKYIFETLRPSKLWNYFLILFTTVTYLDDFDYDHGEVAILDNKKLQELAAMHFNKFVGAIQQVPPIERLFDRRNILKDFISSTSFLDSAYMSDDSTESDTYNNLLPDVFCTLYRTDNKYSREKFYDMMRPLVEVYFESGEVSEYLTDIHHTIERLFGTKDSFNTFIDQCFELSEEDIKIYLIDLGLRKVTK